MNRRGQSRRRIQSKQKKLSLEEINIQEFPFFEILEEASQEQNYQDKLKDISEEIISEIISELEKFHLEIIDAIIIHYQLLNSTSHKISKIKAQIFFGNRGLSYKIQDLPEDLVCLIKIYILMILEVES